MSEELDSATRARLDAQHVEQAEGGFCDTCGSLWEWPCAVRALLAAYDAQAARLADAEAVCTAAVAWAHDMPIETGEAGLRLLSRTLAWQEARYA